MSRYIFLWIGILWFGTISVVGAEVIRVSATQGDATPRIQAAIEKARQYRGKPVVIRLEQGNYHLFRTSCSKQVYYISNTASEEENPDPTKHIGLWIRGIRNLTIEGDGARLVTHGEMTSFVIDSSENIILRNFTLTAADPSVPEMTVVDAGENYLTARIHPDSPYEIREGKFTWLGEGWNFTGGIAQVFEPWRNVTWRCNSPMSDVVKAIELEKGLVRFNYNKRPEGRVGQVFQMRDAIRDEVCGLILKSKQVTLEDLNIHFLGNFGIVGQYSENLTYNRLNCTPEWGHGRTCAGFADFVQMSGCRGKVSILDSRFEGAQDDPINIHGTHLKVMDYPASNQVRVRFMHNQSFGFEAFFKGDPFLLRRMLENLIRNSILHNPAGCQILVSVDMQKSFCCFVVQDKGQGVSSKALKELNQENYLPAEPEAVGEEDHGLGLRIVKQIVRLHNGNIEFSQTTPHGLTVKIFLQNR